MFRSWTPRPGSASRRAQRRRLGAADFFYLYGKADRRRKWSSSRTPGPQLALCLFIITAGSGNAFIVAAREIAAEQQGQVLSC
ncbi:unnamed protein product [Urochloa humidicola]